MNTLPLSLQISSSRQRHGGVHTSVSLFVSGFSIGWLDYRAAVGDLLIALGVGATTNGHSGGKYTMNPKHLWRGYQFDDGEPVIRALFGTSIVDEFNRNLAAGKYALLNGKYCLPAEKINRFFASRYRDRTWCDAVRMKECDKRVTEYLLALPYQIDDDFHLEIRHLHPPEWSARPRMIWKCEDCGTEGHRETFRERTIPGLAGSVGLDCRQCGVRQVDAVHSLLAGQPRGNVVLQPSSVIYPAG